MYFVYSINHINQSCKDSGINERLIVAMFVYKHHAETFKATLYEEKKEWTDTDLWEYEIVYNEFASQ